MAFKRKLAHGMWEHNFFIQQPRYHRRMISVSMVIIIVLNGMFLFAAMSVIIVSETRPLYTRIAQIYNENTSLGDAAVFYASGPSSGNLEYRLCDGPVPKECIDCDDGKGGSSSYGSYAAIGAVGGNSSSSSSSGSIREIGSRQTSNSTTTSTRLIRSRRTDERTASSECICGWNEEWEKCPISSDPAKVFAGANNGAGCDEFFDELKYIWILNMIWGAGGMAIPVLIVLPLFYYSVRYLPLAGGCFPSSYYSSLKANSYLTPFQALLIVDVFAGLVVNGGFLLCQVLILTGTRMMFTTIGDVPSPVSAKNTCGSKSLFAQDFRDDGIFGLWQCAIAGIVFCGLSVLCSLFVLLWVYVSSKPRVYYGFTNRDEFSGCKMPFFPDFEKEAPINGESKVHDEHNNDTGVGRLLRSGDDGGTTSEQMKEKHNNNSKTTNNNVAPVFEFATYQEEEKMNPMLAL